MAIGVVVLVVGVDPSYRGRMNTSQEQETSTMYITYAAHSVQQQQQREGGHAMADTTPSYLTKARPTM